MRSLSTCITPPTSARPSIATSSFSSDDDSSRANRGPSFISNASGSLPKHRRAAGSNANNSAFQKKIKRKDGTNTSTSTSNNTNTSTNTSISAAEAEADSGEHNDDGAKTTHIQVFARIRPVEISEQRQGFFDNDKPRLGDGNNGGGSSSSRRCRLPSPRSLTSALPTPRKPSVPTRSSLAAVDSSPDDCNSRNRNSDPTSVVAWNVSDEGDTAIQSEANTTLIQGRTHSYTLDKIYGTSAATQDLYEQSIKPLVQDAMQGYHSSILAYGQTSTGKTFTMTGTPESPGLIPLCMHECFNQLELSNSNANRDFLFRLSYLEVYKEHIRDLLATAPQPIRLFENATTGLTIRGLKEEIVTSPEQIFILLREGERRRQVGATHMNQHSSRSHVIVRLWIESSVAKSSASSSTSRKNDCSTTRISSLSLVDLAGSESVRLNGAERREEGQYINKSLMTLGQVVLQLSEQSNGNGRYRQHIPYRDSKLTRLLQPSLSGNARMVLLCCISPLATHLEESHNTFKFATRAKRIKQKAVVNITDDANADATLLQTYRDEIDDLKQQLKEARREQQKALATAVASGSAADPAADDDEVHELVEAIQSMERLILKSRPIMHGNSAASHASSEKRLSQSGSDLDLLLEDDNAFLDINDNSGSKSLVIENDGDELLVEGADIVKSKGSSLLVTPLSTFPTTPISDDTSNADDNHDGELQSELNRIRGLLGSVLKKRGMTPMRGNSASTFVAERRKQFNFGSPLREPINSNNNEEVLSLRKQLKQQEVTTNLRKADSSFLQRQLAEKDQLLEEIAKVLEAVEARQTLLERENAYLRNELTVIKARSAMF